jgi:hypothetical protein|tara:strand:- start:54 stop:521 length:468 start_codon:yes stop_codon:yes gene_type:complete
VSDDNIILFPTNRIKNKENVGVKDTRFQKRIEKEQTTKFIESAVDDIALKLLHNFVDLAMKTQSETFTKDFSFLVDVLRSTIKRDFGMNHIVQKMVDKSVELKVDRNNNQMARIDYEKLSDMSFKKKTKPLSNDVNDELNPSGIEFTPDFDPPEK